MSHNYFILHGHFYQPPRENPWTGYIDRQTSAYPYNDWNVRIYNECYASCSRTPILNHDEVFMIMNCYEYLSFNFGPTLLEWMDSDDTYSETLERIVDGDKISVLRNSGHGNAIAQVYNHIIMPLANARDQYTQILWGLQDFKKRFHRDSEGIWLGETAINNETAAILVDCGIKFVILSPFQCQMVMKDGNKKDVNGGRVDPTKPYLLHTKNGPLAIFFYDPTLASEISFGELLSDSEKLYNAVTKSFFNQSQDIKLVHTATDGEVYGHHKPYGNMALARMIYNVIRNQDAEFQFTNYGKFLADFPPTEECELYLGDHREGSSWSCAHGVGRWIRDCGCHTGGKPNWNQKWRTPLREFFDELRNSLHTVIEEQTKHLLLNIWDARNDYFIPMRSNTIEDFDHFFKKHQKKELTDQEKIFIIKVMESLRYSMLMYTSCGWFFSDLSGIETVQDILYAVRAYEFSKDILDPQLNLHCREILDKAKSNIPSQGSGTNILDINVQKYHLSLNTLREYICWLFISQGSDALEHCSHEFLFELVWSDKRKNRYLIHFKNYMGLNLYTAFFLEEFENQSKCYLLWKDTIFQDKESFSKESFWNKDSTWNRSYLSAMPLFLRVRFLASNIEYEMSKGYYSTRAQDSLNLDAVWGIESFLLPYEKRILVFHYASNIYQFSKDLLDDKAKVNNIDMLIRELELLKKNSPSHEDTVLYLNPIAEALQVYLRKALNNYDLLMLKNSKIIFWGLKDNISMTILDSLRQIVYTFYKKDFDKITDPVFIMELNSIIRDMGFSSEFL